ncbi:Nucleolar complex protein 4 -like protein [Halotydeus destructor]|nr:Nucleolar complex protein 4 -like protein [Halotydeus destructor]
MEKLRTVEEIKATATSILSDKTQVNGVVAIIEHLKNGDSDISDTAQRAICKVFTRFLQVKEMVNSAGDTQSLTEYRKWLANCYSQAKLTLIQLISDPVIPDKSRNLALEHCMKLLTVEGKYPIDVEGEPTKVYFPADFLKSVITALLSSEQDMSNIIKKYQEYVEYDDVKVNSLKCLHELLREKKENQTEQFVINAHALLSLIQFPILGKKPKRMKSDKKKSTKTTDLSSVQGQLLCEPLDPTWPKFKLDYEKGASRFASVWLLFLSFKIPTSMYRKILLKMDEKILPHFRNPLSLTDFLVNSFDVGGSVSLLALSSLYILIQKCNLEYPDFFTKLYSMLEPDILYVKYRAKFFFWADIFLTSSHLPAYLVAAFVKRASRLCLTAPVDAQVILIPFIGNILVRHSSLVEAFINRTIADELDNDPFNNEESDPKECRALDSCLWEIKTLQKHWHPRIASAACFINKKLPTSEFDLSELLETSFDELMEETMEAEIKALDNYEFDTVMAEKMMKQFALRAM